MYCISSPFHDLLTPKVHLSKIKAKKCSPDRLHAFDVLKVSTKAPNLAYAALP
jgi:hypothetical protein